MIHLDVAIIGAGPNGLSAALELRSSGLTVLVFGHPMQFWAKVANASPRRYLKSFCFGTQIYSSQQETKFTEWSRDRGLETFEPCAISDFARYGVWLQEKLLPNVIKTSVISLGKSGNEFLLTNENGTVYCAKRVIIATGLSYFHHIPEILQKLPDYLCSHSNAVGSYRSYCGRSVAVIGGGQSALEAATLLNEHGAKTKLFARGPSIKWTARLSGGRTLLERLRWPTSPLGVGVGWWVLAHWPGIFPYLPRKVRERYRHLPSQGAWWLRERFEKSGSFATDTNVIDARECRGEAELLIEIGSAEPSWHRFDHVIAATGFVVDVEKLTFLTSELRSSIRRVGLAPSLDRHFQSSVSGLYFVGPAASVKGPLVRFVAGSSYTSPIVSRHIKNSLPANRRKLIQSRGALRAMCNALVCRSLI